MSDLDENLTSILSSLIDAESIETPIATELVDTSNFSTSRLDFANLASCITGSDASLHQTSDENVSSLLESHLNDLTETVNTSVVDTSVEHLDDVTPFDLDKPIESLLETGASEFISPVCSEPSLSIVNKTGDLQNVTSQLMHNETLNELGNVQSVLDSCNQNGDDICQNVIQTEVNQSQKNQTVSSALESVDGNDEIQENIDTNTTEVESQSNQLCAAETEVADEEVDDECGETIIADQISNDKLIKEPTQKSETRRRRRILVYEDETSGNSELEEERERLLRSKSPTPTQTPSEHPNEPEDSNAESGGQKTDLIGVGIGDDDQIDYIRDPHEKPGPKSKKNSTHIYNALKAKALLESAIVIPARKRKKRVIDSDDEYNESALNQPIDTVDDIGLIPDNDNTDMELNLTIETEHRFLTYEEPELQAKPKIRIKNDLLRDMATANAGRQTLTRSITQAKMEKYHANNNRRLNKQKESKDIFGIPLNAPYVDSSSDEDYFLPQASNQKRNPQNNVQRRANNGNTFNTCSAHQRRKKGHIPDEIYFNATVPLHVLYSYDDSSSDDERKDRSANRSQSHSQNKLLSPTNRALNKMPPVHKIVPRSSHGRPPTHKTQSKHSDRVIKIPKPASKPTVFEQLDKLKRLLRESGIKVNVNELLKGSKTFQERCERIRDTLQRNGIEGEPTMAKCKQLRKRLKLEEEIAGLDPNAIIETKEDDNGNDDNGRPMRRTTRRATRRNYVYDEPEDKPYKMENKEKTLHLLQNLKEVIDSDSDYDGEKPSQNENSNTDSNNIEAVPKLDAIVPPQEINAITESGQVQQEEPATELLTHTDAIELVALEVPQSNAQT